MANVIVTGGGGFIGSHLVDRLVAEGHHVRILDISWNNMTHDPQAQALVKYSNSNVEKLTEIKRGLTYIGRKVDVIFHLAAQVNLRDSIEHPVADARTNILGTINMLEIARRKKSKFVFTSTGGAIYSPDEQLPWNEESVAEPKSPYGIAKMAAEHYIKNGPAKNHCILRLSNVYGPRQDPFGEAGVVSIFIDKIKKKQPLTIFGDGNQTRDFIYVSDVVDALMKAGFSDMTGTYNVSTTKKYSVLDVAHGIMSRMNAMPELVHKEEIPGELKHSLLDSRKLMSTGWVPKVGFYQGLDETIKYFS